MFDHKENISFLGAVNDLVANDSMSDLEIEYLVKRYGRGIFSYCFHLLRNKEDAEDAVQEIFLKVYKNYKKKKTDDFSLWIYKIAYNHCLNVLRYIRKFKGQVTFEDNMFSYYLTPEEELENTEFSEQIQSALGRLSVLQKNIIILRAVEGLNYEDISKITKHRPESIRKNYERAKRKIVKYINTVEGVIHSEKSQNI